MRNLEILVFQEGRKPGTRRKIRAARTNNKLNPAHKFDFSEIQPGLHWCEASALTTVSTFSLLEWLLIFLYAKGKFSPHILVLDRELPFHIITRLFVLHYTCENATDKENKSTR